ncbi:group II intron maturase-specific domain-containing protein [Streptomyces celluloflavus]|uniref:group II intron maturase-specific domain-containing protein n=1 Tax=Streptomyces celluloflavus TaxID=58344 RepID=UPI00345F7B24|nr:hypothetical protein OG717_32905 [Streptomyces celluloflavus]
MQIRHWRLHLRSDTTLEELAREINPVVRGWIYYFGRFHPSALLSTLNRINDYLVRWLVRKYKRFKRKRAEASESTRGPEPSRQAVPRTLCSLETRQTVTVYDWTMGAV